MMDKQKRKAMLQIAVDSLRAAEYALGQLTDSYTEEHDGKFSACHPQSSFASSLGQLTQLRKSLMKARV
ncbi:hypothetical protein FNN36_21815 [Salmonella enterica]|uniref:Uncharacterized protein n=5 Tax=Salmonella enterica TaxID=28901 RepID=A0A637BI02_SALNE|nr:hypothetical protein [Salmonella enterica]ECG1401013.1 hypothetical protein [Salmonella enterica subsp. enterica serovar Panama str. CFSAN000601]ECT9273853.1 hypothetical protein [Salmonella enterica subsp. enterica serovar Newport str. CFSAN000597]EDE1737675.1 hypothetical protein [Salmonella enterica subsp. enterica serovar Montevideo]EDE1889140.1 hypothetical protein [Salmonella enterica subsp. enterica serovar Enteritidis]EDF3737323.1 hypothetical protein [Salmonella enterica subsp. ent